MPQEYLDMHIGERLATLRGRKSQREIAKKSNVDVSTLSRIERGKIDPNLSTLERIAGALGYGLPQLFSDEPFLARPESLADDVLDLQEKLAALEERLIPVFELASEVRRHPAGKQKRPA